jgi:hypothetical protein
VSATIKLPENPRQGDVIEWWTMQHHPIKPYIQRHRATYYASAACADVLGDHYKSARAFDQEWLIETWYEPGSSKTSGGRNTTEALCDWLTAGPRGGSVHATWEGARDAVAANMRERAAELRTSAQDLEHAAARLEATPAPTAVP